MTEEMVKNFNSDIRGKSTASEVFVYRIIRFHLHNACTACRHSGIITEGGMTLEEWLTNQANAVNYFTTNGQLFPNLEIVTGQTKRFRW